MAAKGLVLLAIVTSAQPPEPTAECTLCRALVQRSLQYFHDLRVTHGADLTEATEEMLGGLCADTAVLTKVYNEFTPAQCDARLEAAEARLERLFAERAYVSPATGEPSFFRAAAFVCSEREKKLAAGRGGRAPKPPCAGAFELSSPRFAPRTAAGADRLPRNATCDADGGAGAAGPPPLEWAGAPKGTRSFAVAMRAGSVPPPREGRPFPEHLWIGWDMPASARGAAEHAAFPVEGLNQRSEVGYAPPCPPERQQGKPIEGKRDVYRFDLLALDVAPPLFPGYDPGVHDAPTAEHLFTAVQGHILGTASLDGWWDTADPRRGEL